MAPLSTGIAKAFGFSAASGEGPIPKFEATGGDINEPGNGYKYHLFDYPNSDNFVVTDIGTTGEIEVLVVGVAAVVVMVVVPVEEAAVLVVFVTSLLH